MAAGGTYRLGPVWGTLYSDFLPADAEDADPHGDLYSVSTSGGSAFPKPGTNKQFSLLLQTSLNLSVAKLFVGAGLLGWGFFGGLVWFFNSGLIAIPLSILRSRKS